jgi:hypothetical protein
MKTYVVLCMMALSLVAPAAFGQCQAPELVIPYFHPDNSPHSADVNGDHKIDLSELMRVIQFFNSHGYHSQEGTEDGYAPGPGPIAVSHKSDYMANGRIGGSDGRIDMTELTRAVQFFNAVGYCKWPMTEDFVFGLKSLFETEDGFAPTILVPVNLILPASAAPFDSVEVQITLMCERIFLVATCDDPGTSFQVMLPVCVSERNDVRCYRQGRLVMDTNPLIWWSQPINESFVLNAELSLYDK